jgi:hypothetical protein
MAGKKVRVSLPQSERLTGGAYQIWHDGVLVRQGGNYGAPPRGEETDFWHPIGLVQRQEADYSILLYIPTDAAPGEYELRVATTTGPRSGKFQVEAEDASA